MFHTNIKRKKKEYSIFVFSKFMKNIEIKMKSVWVFYTMQSWNIVFIFILQCIIKSQFK